MGRYQNIIDQTVKPLAFLWELRQDVRQYRWRLFAISFLSVGISIQQLITPQLTRMIIDEAYPSRNLKYFFMICGGMVVLNILSSVFQAIQDYLATYVNGMVSVKVRLRVFQALNRLPLSYVEGRNSGMLLERTSHDADVTAGTLANFTSGLVSLILTTVTALVLMLKINLVVTLLVFFCVPFYYFINTLLATKMRSWENQMRSKTDQVTSLMAEMVQGIPTAKYFDANKWLCSTYTHLLREKLTITFGMWRTQLIYGRLAWAISYGWGIMLTCGGWYLVFRDHLLLGETVALGMYVPLLFRPAEEAVRMYRSLMTSSVCAQRINDVIAGSKTIETGGRSTKLHRLYEIDLRDVSFAYPNGTRCLRNVSVKFKTGETVVILGHTGSGKTTLLRLLAGGYEGYKGNILVNRNDLRHFKGNDYQSDVGMIMPENYFFSGSILENLQLAGSHVTQAEIERFAQILGVDSWIRSLPNGFRTQLGVNGMQMSSGQTQKMAVLRAFLKRPKLLLMDEVTSAMDIESERQILDGIRILRPPRCITVITTHRLALTLESWVNRLIILVEGQVVEQGSARELYDLGGKYRRLIDLSNLGGFFSNNDFVRSRLCKKNAVQMVKRIDFSKKDDVLVS